MILVIDANILFSALIKDSLTAELIFDNDLILVTPEFIIDEFLKYEDLILRKMHRSNEDYVLIMHMLKDIVNVIPEEEYSQYIKEASTFSPDEKDTLYLALALKLNSAIWSNDKKLQNQDRVKVYSTEILRKKQDR
jgi:predicted nucleic acid-binding protein